MSAHVAWNRLVRYESTDRGEIRYGEPLVDEQQSDHIAQLAAGGQLKVEVLEGRHPLDVVRTGKQELVGELLGPLTPSDVPIIRCIGLNYKTHSTSDSGSENLR